MKKYFNKLISRKVKAFVCFMLSFLLVFPYVSQIVMESVKAEVLEMIAGTGTETSETSRIYEHNGYTIVYEVKASWTGHQVIEVTLKNIGDSAISNWMVSIDNGSDKTDTNTAGSEGNTSDDSATISGLWNAIQASENQSENILIKCQTYNNTIKSGESVTFGYTLTGENLKFPDDISLCMSETVIEDGYRLEYQETGDWGSQFQGEIKLINESKQAISGWKLRINGNFSIDNIWNCELTEEDEGTYIIAHTSWQNTIPVGAEYAIGFVGSKSDEEMLIESWELSVVDKGGYSDDDESESESESENENASESTSEPQTEKATGSEAETESVSESESESQTEPEKPSEQVTEAESTTEMESTSGQASGTEKESESGALGGQETESDTMAEIFATGKYNSEAGSIDLEWFTDYENGYYEILISDDNINYTSLGEVTEGTTYQYVISEDFESRYYKVVLITESGKRVEAVPFGIIKNGDGYSTELPDNDGDKVPDAYEKMLGTDMDKVDTDEDGLTDYQEVCLTGTDPTKYDSAVEGTSDADVDLDNDGLTNAKELEIGTNPKESDTDGDTLSDGDEINIHETDPLKADTDDDTINDYDEMQIGLDPTNPATFGVADSKYQIVQNVSEKSESLSEINTPENPYKLSVDINAAGYVEGNLVARETGYAEVIENDAMLGMAAELQYGGNMDSVTLKFSISEENVNNSLNLFDGEEELSGIKRLNVFKYFEDLNMLIPIETFHDTENNLVYAETDELGTYCVMDMEKWLNGFEVPEEAYKSETAVMTLSPDAPMLMSLDAEEEECKVVAICDESDFEETYDEEVMEMSESIQEVPMLMSLSDEEEEREERQIDVVFLLQSGGDFKGIFNLEKDMIIYVTDKLIDEFGRDNIRVCVIDWSINEVKIHKNKDEEIWFTDLEGIQQALDGIVYKYEWNAYKYKENVFDILLEEVKFRNDASKFVIDNLNNDTCDVCFMPIYECASRDIKFLRIIPPVFRSGGKYSEQNKLLDAIEKACGSELPCYTSKTQDWVLKYICKYSEKVKFNAIVPTGWKTITLKERLNPTKGTDTDEDGLSDWEEVVTEMISWDSDGNIVLPTIQQCINSEKKPYAEDGLARFKSEQWGAGMPSSDFERYMDYVLNSIYILPISSDPTMEDSDGDGLLDGKSILINEGTSEEKAIAPKDADALKYNGPKNLWKTHIAQVQSGEKLAREYSDDYFEFMELEAELKYFMDIYPYLDNNLVEVFMAELSAYGSLILDFRYDDKHLGLHADNFQWQYLGGYCDLYDWIFDAATSMNKEKIDFNYNGEDYVIWAWKGNYLNLGPGAEVGFYKKNYWLDAVGLEHWIRERELPMSLSLYREIGNDIYSTYYNWMPYLEQWWITGFVPDIYDYGVNENELFPIASVDFSNYPDMYKAIKAKAEKSFENNVPKENVIFDDKFYTLWIVW